MTNASKSGAGGLCGCLASGMLMMARCVLFVGCLGQLTVRLMWLLFAERLAEHVPDGVDSPPISMAGYIGMGLSAAVMVLGLIGAYTRDSGHLKRVS
jgi:hypothetical protein